MTDEKGDTEKETPLHWDAQDLDMEEFLSGQATGATGEPSFHFEKMWPEAETF